MSSISSYHVPVRKPYSVSGRVWAEHRGVRWRYWRRKMRNGNHRGQKL